MNSAEKVMQRSGGKAAPLFASASSDPLDLAIGDPVDFLSAGAYTASVAAVAFNGFPPIRSYFV